MIFENDEVLEWLVEEWVEFLEENEMVQECIDVVCVVVVEIEEIVKIFEV